jgi:acyl-coenzyme A synthetase/AMP-(fatty) acid ligase
VTRGYMDEPEKTAAAYIDRPTWLQPFRKNFNTGDASGRLYKTGDLVQYNTDGTIRYIGRKDTQVKSKQRMSLFFFFFFKMPPPSAPRQFSSDSLPLTYFRGKLL